jgi:hypothetical protein
MMYGSIGRQRGAGETHGESSMKQTIITCKSNHTSMFVSRYMITFLGERRGVSRCNDAAGVSPLSLFAGRVELAISTGFFVTDGMKNCT